MTEIKGIVIFGKEKPAEAVMSRLGFFKTYIKNYGGKELLVIRTGRFANTRRLASLLKRKNITEAAVFPETTENLALLSDNGITPVTFEAAMINALSAVVIKTASSLGMKKGRVRLGILSQSRFREILTALLPAADHLCEIYIYGKRSEEKNLAAEAFFDETGISVILSGRAQSKDQILISSEKSLPEGFGGVAVSLSGKSFPGIKTVCGIRTEISQSAKEEDIPDCVVSALCGISPKITKLIFSK